MLPSPDIDTYISLVAINRTREGEVLKTWLKEARRRILRNVCAEPAAVLGAQTILSELEEEFEKAEPRLLALMQGQPTN